MATSASRCDATQRSAKKHPCHQTLDMLPASNPKMRMPSILWWWKCYARLDHGPRHIHLLQPLYPHLLSPSEGRGAWYLSHLEVSRLRFQSLEHQAWPVHGISTKDWCLVTHKPSIVWESTRNKSVAPQCVHQPNNCLTDLKKMFLERRRPISDHSYLDPATNSRPPSAWTLSSRPFTSTFSRCSMACTKHWACGVKNGRPTGALPCLPC